MPRASNPEGSSGGKQMSPRQRRARLKLTVMGATTGASVGAAYGGMGGLGRARTRQDRQRARARFNLQHESRGFGWETSGAAKGWAVPVKQGVGITTKRPTKAARRTTVRFGVAGAAVGGVAGGVAGYRTANAAARGRGFDTSRRSGRSSRQRRDRRGRFS